MAVRSEEGGAAQLAILIGRNAKKTGIKEKSFLRRESIVTGWGQEWISDHGRPRGKKSVVSIVRRIDMPKV